MPDGDIRPAIRVTRRRVFAGPVLAGAMLAAFLLALDIPGSGNWVGVKPAAASHDESGDKGKGHTGQGGGAGQGGGGGGSGDDDEPGGSYDGGDGMSGISGEADRGGSAMEEAEAEEAALGEALRGVEPDDPSAAGGATAGLPTIRQVFALPEDAVVGPDEEQALIASGWSAR